MGSKGMAADKGGGKIERGSLNDGREEGKHRINRGQPGKAAPTGPAVADRTRYRKIVSTHGDFKGVYAGKVSTISGN